MDQGASAVTYTQKLTFDEFITQYFNNPRYELIDGELRAGEPTGPHEAVSGKIVGHFFAEILRSQVRWLIPKNCLIKPPPATALRPDVIVLDAQQLDREPLWRQEPIITNSQSTNSQSIKLVVEVVSTNWQDDYVRKFEEYAFLKIPEYWIVDYRVLGELHLSANPSNQPSQLVNWLERNIGKRNIGGVSPFRLSYSLSCGFAWMMFCCINVVSIKTILEKHLHKEAQHKSGYQHC